ncbi:hypothetical protein PTI98_003979 [Pleurotus ostreatus]|nr:hypothetical protein PTI98_003979 [Pleurotus ostreatus]
MRGGGERYPTASPIALQYSGLSATPSLHATDALPIDIPNGMFILDAHESTRELGYWGTFEFGDTRRIPEGAVARRGEFTFPFHMSLTHLVVLIQNNTRRKR